MSTPTWLAIKRRQTVRAKAAAAPASVEPEKSYRDLQAAAKDLDIPANQSREDLEAAIEAASEEDEE